MRSLDPGQWTRRRRIPITTVARALLDLAETVRSEQLERAFEQAERHRLLDLRSLERVCERSPGRHGLRPLRELIAREHSPPGLNSRSELERRFLVLCRGAGLPTPAVNVALCGFEVDMLWRRGRLVVELDGYAFHRTRAAFERDRARDAARQVAGYRVLRVTHRGLESNPAKTVAALRSLLGMA